MCPFSEAFFKYTYYQVNKGLKGLQAKTWFKNCRGPTCPIHNLRDHLDGDLLCNKNKYDAVEVPLDKLMTMLPCETSLTCRVQQQWQMKCDNG